jgi:hypothetical protein
MRLPCRPVAPSCRALVLKEATLATWRRVQQTWRALNLTTLMFDPSGVGSLRGDADRFRNHRAARVIVRDNAVVREIWSARCILRLY